MKTETMKLSENDSYICKLADRLEVSMREAYNAEVSLAAALFAELRNVMKDSGFDAEFIKYTSAREKYAVAYWQAEQADTLATFKMALPTPPAKVKELALEFKRAAKKAAAKYDYQPQWIQKNLLAMDDELFRERAAREDKGTTKTSHPKFKQDQIDYVAKVAKGLHLNSVQIEALIHALA
jgi:hypothetical protein